ncbi:hypothetical protein [Modestobacter versicolor]|uniref:Uncharacterized protein n=1 Tax=Modestobacter versicolor TaxID=429133 RepID=A0A323VDQ9_9ACTN|nr:hypothetical protein [Modestobacter versicolor]MBB3676304.1 hypothetical protein [Modestobacter versicolor]PZA22765.1 hypothetical protein DMO24_03365 [Modestobacter versicolor]
MSTPTHDTDRARTTAVVPAPRKAADPPVDDASHRSGNRQTSESEPLGMFGRHAWLIPALGVASTIAVFVSMILLTWIAGGGTPFD